MFTLTTKPKPEKGPIKDSDLLLFFIAKVGPRYRFASKEQHFIKGLDNIAPAQVPIPIPDWFVGGDYQGLLDSNENPQYADISLNINLFSWAPDDAEWEDQWFSMEGLIHPYTLTWDMKDLEGEEGDYSAPVAIVRDGDFRPALEPDFSTIPKPLPPSVSFTGTVIGPGTTLLSSNGTTRLDEAQRKCCGFVQLVTYIFPGKDHRTPSQGNYSFQVLVMFPIREPPWNYRGDWMVQKQGSVFKPGASIYCAGKIIGLLNHDVMEKKPANPQDLVFIIKPETFKFLSSFAAGESAMTESPKAGSSTPNGTKARPAFFTPKSKSPGTKRALPPEDDVGPSTPSKKPRQQPAEPTPETTRTSTKTLATAGPSTTKASQAVIEARTGSAEVIDVIDEMTESTPSQSEGDTSTTRRTLPAPLDNKERPKRNHVPTAKLKGTA